MFTGIVEEVGQVLAIANNGGKRKLTVSASTLSRELQKGDSICVSGACLTAVEVAEKSFSADLAAETWTRTSFSRLRKGAFVNLELPMRADGRFGGHIVQGHVDGTGRFLSLNQVPSANDYRLQIKIPPDLGRYVIFKGSLSIEGISLTVAKVEGTKVSVAIIPHTAEVTNLKSLHPGDPVNLEVDLISKYIEKMMKADCPGRPLRLKDLVRNGF